MDRQRRLPLPAFTGIPRPSDTLSPLEHVRGNLHPLTISRLPHQLVAVVADLQSSRNVKQASS